MSNQIHLSRKLAESMDWSYSAIDCHKRAYDAVSSRREKSMILNRIARCCVFNCRLKTAYECYTKSILLNIDNAIARNALKHFSEFNYNEINDLGDENNINTVRNLVVTARVLFLSGFRDKSLYIIESNMERFNNYCDQIAIAASLRFIDLPERALMIYDEMGNVTHSAVALTDKAACLMDLNRYEEAEKILKPIFQDYPDDPYILRTFARFLSRFGNKGDVNRLFRKAEEIESCKS